MGGSTIGTLIYMQCAVLVDVWKRNIPGLGVTLMATPGSAANQGPIDQGDLDIASSSIAADYWALNGMHFRKTKLSNLCSLLPANIGFHHAFTYADSPIKSWKDLDGKRVALGARASATSISNEEILGALNIKPKFVFSTPAEAADIVKDRRVDALVYGVGAPYSMFIDIAKAIPIRFIPMAPQEQEKVAKAIPYVFPGSIPAKTYSFQNEDWPCVVTYVNFIVRPGLSEDLVYKLTKVAWENWDEVGKAVSAAKSVSPKDMMRMVAPIHPGAVKYYREIGINIPDRLIWKK
jgi:TRAP transporter TAXI family solute receptor